MMLCSAEKTCGRWPGCAGQYSGMAYVVHGEVWEEEYPDESIGDGPAMESWTGTAIAVSMGADIGYALEDARQINHKRFSVCVQSPSQSRTRWNPDVPGTRLGPKQKQTFSGFCKQQVECLTEVFINTRSQGFLTGFPAGLAWPGPGCSLQIDNPQKTRKHGSGCPRPDRDGYSNGYIDG